MSTVCLLYDLVLSLNNRIHWSSALTPSLKMIGVSGKPQTFINVLLTFFWFTLKKIRQQGCDGQRQWGVRQRPKFHERHGRPRFGRVPTCAAHGRRFVAAQPRNADRVHGEAEEEHHRDNHALRAQVQGQGQASWQLPPVQKIYPKILLQGRILKTLWLLFGYV